MGGRALRRGRMKREYFGTDGVRGRFGGPVVNPVFFRRLAFAAGKAMAVGGSALPTAAIGRDTRASGEALEAAVAEGLLAAGWNVSLLGVLPTPAVALATRESGAAMGVALTASHNPVDDNGIKFFSGAGAKLDDAREATIEGALPPGQWAPLPIAGCDIRAANGVADYIAKMSALLPARCLSGWRIGFDGANGAACETTPAVLRALGAELSAIGCGPDGTNINAGCGSEHPQALSALVRATGARVGIAHDGDGDRVVLCDENGVALDGDEIMTLVACNALERDTLKPRRVVMTVQSNFGVDAAIRAAGGEVIRSEVGDRYVASEMKRTGAVIGGESSGHFIFSKVSPTGDGLVAALEVLRVMIATGRPLSELRRRLVRFPQRSAAIRVREKKPLDSCATISRTILAASGALGSGGRVLVRYSGTEPKIRLLVEGPDEAKVARWMEQLREAVGRDLETLD